MIVFWQSSAGAAPGDTDFLVGFGFSAQWHHFDERQTGIGAATEMGVTVSLSEHARLGSSLFLDMASVGVAGDAGAGRAMFSVVPTVLFGYDWYLVPSERAGFL